MGEEAKQEEQKVEAAPAEGGTEETKEKEEKPAEEKKEEEEKPAEEAKPPPPFILYVDLHCVGCAKKIQKSILKIRGVEGVLVDMDKNQVTIKGVVDPQAVCNKIMKTAKRMAKVLSPLPATEGEPLPPVVTSQVAGVATVELNVNMHCDACAEQLKKKILKMRGVQNVVTELNAGKVTVTGTMDGERLVDYVYRRTKKQAKIVPQPEPEPGPKPEPEPEPKPEPEPEPEPKPEPETPAEEGEKKEDKEEERPAKAAAAPPEEENKDENLAGEEFMTEEEGMKRMMYYYQPLYVIERIPPPQIFSDENPNACCIV